MLRETFFFISEAQTYMMTAVTLGNGITG